MIKTYKKVTPDIIRNKLYIFFNTFTFCLRPKFADNVETKVKLRAIINESFIPTLPFFQY